MRNWSKLRLTVVTGCVSSSILHLYHYRKALFFFAGYKFCGHIIRESKFHEQPNGNGHAHN